MGFRDKVKKAAIGGLAAIVIALSSADKARASPMKVSTVPVSSSGYFERGGDYQLEVYADSTMNPSQTIVSSQWDVAVPSYVTIMGAGLPSSNDFFDGISTVNSLKTSVAGGELVYNWRDSDDGTSGAMNKKGLLEIIDFKINNDAPLDVPMNFDLNDVYFTDSANNVYDLPSGVSISNTSFTVSNVPEPATLGLLAAGALALAFRNRKQRRYVPSRVVRSEAFSEK